MDVGPGYSLAYHQVTCIQPITNSVVLNFGTKELKAKVIPECLEGRKVICLAVSEPTTGSDVASIVHT